MNHSLRTYLLIALCSLCLTIQAADYASQSVLANGNIVRVRVSRTGLAYITYNEIASAGLDPTKVQVFGYGGAELPTDFSKMPADDLPSVPVYLATGNDGVWGPGDYLIFYAQGPVSWRYNTSNRQFSHTRNTYSDYGYYFLSDCAGSNNLITTELASGTSTGDCRTYQALQVRDEDRINLIDPSGTAGGGRHFYEPFNSPATYRFNFPDILTTPMQVSVECAATAQSSITVQAGTQSQTLSISQLSDMYAMASLRKKTWTAAPTSGQEEQTVTLTFNSYTGGASAYLNYIELVATCQLVLHQEPLLFRHTDSSTGSGLLTYYLSGADQQTQVWNVTDPKHIYRASASFVGSELAFAAPRGSLQQFVAFRPDMTAGMEHATLLSGRIANQNLHELEDVDMMIITHPTFLPAAERLAAAHEDEGMIVAIATTDQVYNEFSSGTPDATAYRRLMKMLWDRGAAGQGRKPQSLLLVGDGTYDNRKRFSSSGNNWILTYQAENSVREVDAYSCDDYFALLQDQSSQPGYADMDIAVGRLPVNTLSEADGVVNKLIAHMTDSTRGLWNSNVIFLADDGDANQHTRISDEAAEHTRMNNPDLLVHKVYLDAYTQVKSAAGESYPVAKNKLDNLLSAGTLLLDYSGHGGFSGVTNEGMITTQGVRGMQNRHPGVWMFATCSFSHWDSGHSSAGEESLLNPNGGSIGTISSCRTVYADRNQALNTHFCDTLFAHGAGRYHMTVGEALRCAKNKTSDALNKLCYSLLGDPAIRLHMPDDYRVVTSTRLDTLRALSVQHIEGYITDGRDTATWFNGNLNVSLYDKEQTITTLNNDKNTTSDGTPTIYSYLDRPNMLFKGSTEVKDGRFAFDFMVPKDIVYSYGNGRLLYYAYDTISREQAMGHSTDFLIGGSSPFVIDDTEGPKLTIYLDRPNFKNGGKTTTTPHFYAVIEDEHGINTASSGIGHDLMLTIDNDPSQSYVLNDYFSTDMGSYSKGRVSYLLSSLKEGKHTLTFRAWDLLNNSSRRSLDFEVVSNYVPEIYDMLFYPNPVSISGDGTIYIDFNQTDVPITADIRIFDLSGRCIYTFRRENSSSIRWNIASAGVRPGAYIYNVSLSAKGSRVAQKAGKFIVTQ